MRTPKLYYVLMAVFVLAAGGVIWYIFFGRIVVQIIDSDTTLKGDFVIEKNKKVLVKNGAKLTVEKDLKIEGELTCEGGTLDLTVGGNLVVDKQLGCNLAQAPQNQTSITMVVKGSVVFDPSAVIVANSHVQIVSSPEKLARMPEQLDTLFEETGKDTGAGQRLGPFVSEEEAGPTSIRPSVLYQSSNSYGAEGQMSASNQPNSLSQPNFRSQPKAVEPNSTNFLNKLKNLLIKPATATAVAPNPCLEGDKIRPNCYQISGRFVIGNPAAGLGQLPSQAATNANVNRPGLQNAPTNLNIPPISGVYVPLAPRRRIEVPTPPPGARRAIINIDAGQDGDLNLVNLEIAGPDGRPGNNDLDQSCNARGGKGEDAWRANIFARRITISNFSIHLGDGGSGGDARTRLKVCRPANAIGGEGGDAGNFKITAADDLNMAGPFLIFAGQGGEGGKAEAFGGRGQDGCPGENGGEAIARGGKGADNEKNLRALGKVRGVTNVTIGLFGDVEGGDGGLGDAFGGIGGNGTGCGCYGGKGGNGLAFGGKGGDASVKLPFRQSVETIGGQGGDVIARTNQGGNGGNCNAAGPGGKGGDGGDAKAEAGRGGKGTIPGEDGDVTRLEAGSGGKGGDGCKPGKGGRPGQPSGGFPGNDGKNLCPPPPPGATLITPKVPTPTAPKPTPAPPAPSAPPTAPTPTAPKRPTTINVQAIKYGDKFIPTIQLHTGTGPECKTGDKEVEHWHANEGRARTTDDTFIKDPGGCGYGKVNEVPVVTVEISQELYDKLIS